MDGINQVINKKNLKCEKKTGHKLEKQISPLCWQDEGHLGQDKLSLQSQWNKAKVQQKHIYIQEGGFLCIIKSTMHYSKSVLHKQLSVCIKSNQVANKYWFKHHLLVTERTRFSTAINKAPLYLSCQSRTQKRWKLYLVGSHCLVANLPVDGTLNDAWHQLGNIFVIFFLTWYFLHCKHKIHTVSMDFKA